MRTLSLWNKTFVYVHHIAILVCQCRVISIIFCETHINNTICYSPIPLFSRCFLYFSITTMPIIASSTPSPCAPGLSPSNYYHQVSAVGVLRLPAELGHLFQTYLDFLIAKVARPLPGEFVQPHDPAFGG